MGAAVRAVYSFPHQVGAPGIGTTAWHQVAGLAECGIAVRLICTSLARPLPPSVDVVETLAIAGRRIPHRALGARSPRNAYAYHDWRAARLVGALARRGQVDVVHAWPRACIRTLRAAADFGVLGLREAPSPHTAAALDDAAAAASALGLTLPRGHSHAFNPVLLRAEEAEFAAAARVLVPSEYARRTFVDRGYPAERLAVHRYGCDLERFHPPADRPSDGRGGLTALFAGRGEPNKGLHLALRAWLDSGAADQGSFLVAGRIWSEYERLIAGELAHPSVRRLGFVDDLAPLYRRADVLVLPSFTEGSALVTYEAKASGLVLLVSRSTGAPVVDGVDGLLHDAGDVATLTNHLRRLASDRELLEHLRAEALRGRDDLGWDAAGRHLAALYRGLIARSG